MDILFDTNILIHRESDPIVPEDLQDLERAINQEGHRILTHPASVQEVRQDPNNERREQAESRIQTYPELSYPPSPSSSDTEFRNAVPEAADGSNDQIDNMLLFAVYDEEVDFLITEDSGIRRKAQELDIEDRVFSIAEGKEYFSEDPASIRAPAPIQRTTLGELNLSDPIFDSLRSEYREFDSWANSHPDRPTWVNYTDEDELGAILVIKPRETESIGQSPSLPRRTRMKISTFKVAEQRWGSKVGELLISIAIREAINEELDEIYLTHYVSEEDYLVDLIEPWGFTRESSRADGEAIFLKRLVPGFGESFDPIETATTYYPSFVDGEDIDKFLVPILPEYHNKLFTSYQHREIPAEESEGEFLSEANAIKKAYLSNSNIRQIDPGDLLLFYRSSDHHCVTSLGVCQAVNYGLTDADEISRIVGKRSVFSKSRIEDIAQQPTTVLLFNWHFEFETPIDYDELLDNDVIAGAPQSIQRLDEHGYIYIKENGGLDARFARD